MYSVDDIRQEYRRLDKLSGLDTSDVEIEISQRPGRRLGSFRYPLNEGAAPLRIIISASLLGQEEQFWDTIRHEYAHAAVYLKHPGERHGHDKLWQDMCRRLGCSPTRLAPQSEELRRRTQAEAKYRVHCKGCGRDSYYFRAGKVINSLVKNRGRGVRCACCGGQSFDVFIREEGKP